MSQNTLPVTQFTDLAGSALANGYLLVSISTDVQTPTGQLGCRRVVRVDLDASGNVSGTALFWPNASLAPTGTVYVLRAYTNAGQLALGPIYVTVISAAPEGFGSGFGSTFGS